MNLVKKTGLFYKLRFYPIVLTILWVFPIFNRFSYEIAGYNNNWTHFAHIICESLVGTTNMIYYALNPKVRLLIKNKIKSIFCQEELSKETSLVSNEDEENDQTSNGLP